MIKQAVAVRPMVWGVAGLVMGVVWGACSLAAEQAEHAEISPVVERLDAERAEIEAEQQTTAKQAAVIRREISDLERRRQEVLRVFEAEEAALEARQAENSKQAAEQAEAVAARAAEVEHVLRAGGKWVSFTDEIAPLLRARCVACHSSREPGGGHVLTSYAGLFSAGVNGPAVVPGDTASLLCEVVADGSMPQDGEPLSAEEVALLRRWVALGARLDRGAAADAGLVRIMPRPPQPTPPAHYPAAIPVSAMAFNSSNTLLATSGYHEVLLWDLQAVTGGEHATPLVPPLVARIPNIPERVAGLAFAPSGEQLAVAAGTPGVIGEVALLAVGASPAEVGSGELQSLGLADDAFLAVAFAAQGTALAAVAADQSLRLYDADSGVQQAERTDHADWVQAVALSADGNRLVTASRDGTAKVVDVARGQLQTTFAGHAEPVTAACWLDDGQVVATGGGDGRVRIWNADSGKEIRSIKGFTSSIEGLCVLSEGRLAVADRSGDVRLHAVADGKQLHTIPSGGDITTSLAVSADSRWLAVGSLNGMLTLIDLAAEAPAEPLSWLAAP